MTRLHNHQKKTIPICLAINGCSSLEQVSDFISSHSTYIDSAGNSFNKEQLAAQYAFEQTKLDRKGYDSRRIGKYLTLLSSAGIIFNFERALQYADDLVNFYTADFGQDEDGEATFRIRSQTFRLKTYDCLALWTRVEQAQIIVSLVSPGSFSERDEIADIESGIDFLLDFTVLYSLIDPYEGEFAKVCRYVTCNEEKLCVEDLVDFEFEDYPNFHDESGTMLTLMKKKSDELNLDAVQAVKHFIATHVIDGKVKGISGALNGLPQKIFQSFVP